jgi:hypothetical protein
VSQYYYTAAALPTIRLGEKVPISEEIFLQLAEDTLGPEEYRVILRSRWGSIEPTGSTFADRILSWEKELRRELAKARLAGLGSSSPQALPESDGHDVLLEKARTALSLDSPLAAENYLNSLRWSFVEEMSVSHFFDLEALIAYYFKLQLALRQDKFQKAAGQEVFDKVYEKVRESLPDNYL